MGSNPIATALRREKSLLEQVLCLAICQLDLVEAGRLEDLEISLLVREQRMRELELYEENVNAKMPEIENDPTISPTQLAELHYLNLQITGLTDSIAEMDERAQRLVDLELCGSGVCRPKA